jgi:type I restriction enzyme R subunit
MAYLDKTPKHIKLDEKNHVEEPFLKQLDGLGWSVLQLEQKQNPGDSQRESFTDVVILPELRKSLLKINPWLEDDQVEDVVRRITTFPSASLIENNRHVLNLLLENTSVLENRKTGDRSPTVRYVDFENRANNSFLAVSQFKLRILGTEHHIVPDVVLFLNGLPIAVVECKSPKVKEPIPEAIDQLLRYSEQRGAKKEGSAPLFYYNQFVVATCRQQAKFGTITTHTEKYFYRWADPYPRSVDDLEHGGGAPNDQQRLVAGMLDRDNLLSLIRTFTLFSTDDKGQLIKVVGRYQQFRAVKKALQRLLTGANRRERSGIIWHTQGSGKSLTMMFMVREMYCHPKLSHWKVVFVTDRTQLEQQLSETSQSVGFTVKVADSIAKLKELLPSDSSDLVMAMIHKFQERELTEVFPQLNTSQNILIMTDEAHRSQYTMLGANLDRALPNAAKIGYTGTPIDKTEVVFGDYIDKYTMRQSIDDGVTLEIVYEGRTHNAEITDRPAMDKEFADMFSDYKLQDRLQILGYGSRDAYLEAKETIATKAKDIVKHYVEQVFPNGFKAQVVATSREAAVRYKAALDSALQATIAELEKSNPRHTDLGRLRKLKTAVVISSSHNDLPHIKAHTEAAKHEKFIKSFKLPFEGEDKDAGVTGDVGIVIVNNMLITGFDAPIEQVMYLDRVITDHNLLQAIARVNRVSGTAKEKGFVVDYVGVGHHIKAAIDAYDEREQKEILESLGNEQDQLNELAANHKAVMELLKKHGLTDLTDHDAFFDLFYDEDIRFDYLLAFKKLTASMNHVFPRKEALQYFSEYQALAEINVMAAKHLNDARLSMKDIPEKLRVLTDAHLRSKGIDLKVAPISILDANFEAKVGKHKRAKTKAAEVEHAIRHHIDVHIDEDPELYASFAEALEKILQEFKDNWEKIYQEFEKLRRRIKNIPKPPGDLHRKKHMPFFRIFSKEIYGKIHGEDTFTADEEDALVVLTKEIVDLIHREIQLTGFWQAIPARNRLRAEVQQVLLSERFNKLPNIVKNRNHIISRVMELAEANNDIILYAK